MPNQVQTLFLEALQLSMHGQKYDLAAENADQLRQILHLSSIHNVLPMICEAIYESDAARRYPGVFQAYKNQAIREAVSQTIRTRQFLDLLRFLETKDLVPVIVKGLAVRCHYPREYLRASVDEDLLIPPEDAALYHKAMLDYGLEQAEPGRDWLQEAETAYCRKDNGLYIEAHKYLFPPDSRAYGELNRFFEHAQPMKDSFAGRSFLTLSPTDHVFFLFCHFYKHFLHGGCGIRQIGDLIVYSDVFADQIDWERILHQSREMKGECLLASLYRIGSEYLLPVNRFSRYQMEWCLDTVDIEPLLQDVLASGVHGTSEMARMHSSTITLNALARRKEQKGTGTDLLSSVFPPYDSMKGRYRYLEKAPFLLPAAWVQRILGYIGEMSDSRNKRGNDSPAETLRLGRQRLELLKQYRLLEEDGEKN